MTLAKNEQLFTECTDLVQSCLNLWSPEVSSSVQLLGADGTVTSEVAFDARCLEAPSTVADYRLVFDGFATIIEPTHFKNDYYNFLALCKFGPEKGRLEVKTFINSMPADYSTSKYVAKSTTTFLNDHYGLELASEKKKGPAKHKTDWVWCATSENDFPAISLVLNLRHSTCAGLPKLLVKSLKECLTIFSREDGWPLTDCKQRF